MARFHDRELVLDTNIVIHLLRGKTTGQWVNATYALDDREWSPMISVVTVGELHALGRRWAWGPEKLKALDGALAKLPIVNVERDDARLLDAYRELDAASVAQGRKMGKNDLWIAATARSYGAVLLTCDKDFDHLHPVELECEYVDLTKGPGVETLGEEGG